MNTSKPSWLAFDGKTIKDPFFPVQLCPTSYQIEVEDSAGKFVLETRESKRHRAVVDVENKFVFSMVTDNYELITNSDAMELGRECFRTVFKKVDVTDMDLFNTVMPEKRSFCHMDLVHKDAEYDFYAESAWTPYLRVTNSYNRTKLLQFDLGFCRGVCRNGLIFRPESIVFKKSHKKTATEELQEQFQMQRGSFHEMEKAFIESIDTLSKTRIPRPFIWPLFRKVFSIKTPAQDAPSYEKKRFNKLEAHVDGLVETYCNDLGNTGFAAMNVLTDFASRPVHLVGGPSGRIHSLQVTSGIWIEDFAEEARKRDFHITHYLGPDFDIAT